MDAAERVFHRNGLRAARLHILFHPSQAWQQIGDAAIHQMAAVQLGGNLHRKLHVRPGLFHPLTFRNRADEIAPEAKESFDLARQDAFAGFDRVHAVVARWLEAELSCVTVERRVLHFFRDADSTLTLHIGMPTHRRNPRAVTADIALQQQHVDKHGDVLEAVNMLCQAHAVNADDTIGFDINLCGTFDGGTAET